MEIILTQDVDNLGLAGQVLKVSAGYARNYLLPGSFALPATPNNLKTLAKKREEFERRSLEVKQDALNQKQSLESLVLTITRKSVEKGKLYGAVTPQDLVDAAQEQGFTIDRRKLKLSDPIKSIGDYDVTVRLHPEVVGTFKVRVLAEPKPEPEPPAEPEPRRGRGRRARGEDLIRSRELTSDKTQDKIPDRDDSLKASLNATEAKAKADKAKTAKAKGQKKETPEAAAQVVTEALAEKAPAVSEATVPVSAPDSPQAAAAPESAAATEVAPSPEASAEASTENSSQESPPTEENS
ncbi:MAG: 50S ribosomal protein L9 [Deltaproteobacteria bacterium]|jgi:large subunit ribosomal protein L9|nr:50S ribosomal protein L9 [Deltaproteobacteria bacterium]